VERIRKIVDLLDDVSAVAFDRADSATRFGLLCDELRDLLTTAFLRNESVQLPGRIRAVPDERTPSLH
jgi:hypothetical protein